jgi:hypothetical protein
MPATRNATHEAKPVPPHGSTEALDSRAAYDDPTTLKFDAPVAVSDEDAGSDPYNRTGKFRRLVRS